MNVYIFMGSHIPEMQACLDMLAAAIPEGTRARIFHPEAIDWTAPPTEAATVEAYDPETVQWVFDPDSADSAFIVLDPARSPVEQLEELAEDLSKCLIEPVKVVTCVDCQRAESSPQLRSWLDATIYYSDVVLLGNRAKASKPFIRDFQKGYEKQCFPCLFLLLKGHGTPEQPLEILTPDTRRISQLFDLAEAAVEPLPGLVIEASCDLDLEEPEIDPFRDPDPESSQAAPVPDITPWIVLKRT